MDYRCVNLHFVDIADRAIDDPRTTHVRQPSAAGGLCR